MATLKNIKALLIATVINDGGSNTFASFIGLVEQKMNKTGNDLYGRVTRLGKYAVKRNGESYGRPRLCGSTCVVYKGFGLRKRGNS